MDSLPHSLQLAYEHKSHFDSIYIKIIDQERVGAERIAERQLAQLINFFEEGVLTEAELDALKNLKPKMNDFRRWNSSHGFIVRTEKSADGRYGCAYISISGSGDSLRLEPVFENADTLKYDDRLAEMISEAFRFSGSMRGLKSDSKKGQRVDVQRDAFKHLMGSLAVSHEMMSVSRNDAKHLYDKAYAAMRLLSEAVNGIHVDE